jgi:FAD synthase
LGIPTANFDVTEAVNAKIKYLLNGVYVGKILRAGTTYPALIFLGYSEYFGDLKK